jgi:predicted  nucleic acid-binding Zn-ribbon protein
MPFVQREVRPKYLSRVILHDEEGRPRVKDGELEAVTNYTLSSALRQLASVVRIAKEVFDGLNSQLVEVADRTRRLRTKIDIVEEKVTKFDPKTVTVRKYPLPIS